MTTKSEKKVLQCADRALSKALMQLLEIGHEPKAEEKVWQEICRARSYINEVFTNMKE